MVGGYCMLLLPMAFFAMTDACKEAYDNPAYEYSVKYDGNTVDFSWIESDAIQFVLYIDKCVTKQRTRENGKLEFTLTKAGQCEETSAYLAVPKSLKGRFSVNGAFLADIITVPGDTPIKVEDLEDCHTGGI